MAWVAILGGGGEPCNWQMRCRPQSFIKASVGLDISGLDRVFMAYANLKKTGLHGETTQDTPYWLLPQRYLFQTPRDTPPRA